MGKTRSEIQKAYRQRQKEQLGEVWLEAERKRRKTYFVPITELLPAEQKKRRAADATRARRSRQLMKKKKESDGLVVKMNFQAGRGNPTLARRRKISRCLSRANREIQALTDERDKYFRLIYLNWP